LHKIDAYIFHTSPFKFSTCWMIFLEDVRKKSRSATISCDDWEDILVTVTTVSFGGLKKPNNMKEHDNR
jgi:hypothetical protein